MIEETYISLIFTAHQLFLRLNLVQRLVQVLHLVIGQVSCLGYSLLQVFDPHVSLFQSISHLVLHSVVFSLLSLDYPVFLPNLSLEFFSLFFQLLYNRTISLLDVLNIARMDLCYSFFDVVYLQLILSFHFV